MSLPSSLPTSPPPSLPTADAVRRAISTLKAQTKALEGLLKVVSPPAPEGLAKGLAALEKAGEVDVGAIRAGIGAWVTEEKASRRERLSGALRTACEAESVELLVLSKDPLELRLPPLSARIDIEANKAEILFSQQVLETSTADGPAILAARRRALQTLDGDPWDSAAFHGLLHKAWMRAAPTGGWAELIDVLPEVVFLRQPKAFRLDPDPKRFVPYSRARFAYDLWRLRRDRALTRDGWRLSIAPATGSSTKDKKLVYWLEDDRGQGQYHLTLRFVREEPHGPV